MQYNEIVEVLNKIAEAGKWYDSNFAGVLIGFMLTIIANWVSSKINNKRLRDEEIKQVLLMIYQTDSELFSIIYKGATNEKLIDYAKLRKCLMSSNFIFLLPPKLKDEFKSLYEIYLGDNYEGNKHKIPRIIKKISEILEGYGVELFGTK